MGFTHCTGHSADELRAYHPHAILAEVESQRDGEQEHGVLRDAFGDEAVCTQLLDAIERRRTFRMGDGRVRAVPSRRFRELRGAEETLRAVPIRAEQTNSSVVFGTRLVLKLFRRLHTGTNPDLELGRFLTDRAAFPHVAPVAGWIEWERPKAEPVTLAVLHAFVPNEGDAWRYTLDQIEQYLERALVRPERDAPLPLAGSLFDRIVADPPPLVLETIGGYLEQARLLGRRTAELHAALASHPEDPNFSPEPFTTHYQRSLSQSIRNVARRALALLRERSGQLPAAEAADAERLLRCEDRVLHAIRQIVGPPLDAMRIRCHGDLHLGQVLHTGSDFVFIDFEGEPARSLVERRLERSPLRDVAGMLRSFDYASQAAVAARMRARTMGNDEARALAPWARFWRSWVQSAFLRSYLRCAEPAALVPSDRSGQERLLDVLLLEKALYELGYELGHRPEWAGIPIRGVLELLGEPI